MTRRALSTRAVSCKAAVKSMAADANTPYHLFVYGELQEPTFQRVKAAAEFLASERSNIEATIEGYFETQYEQQLKYIINQYGGDFAQSDSSAPLVFAETSDSILYFKDEKRFMDWAAKRFKYEVDTRFSYEDIGNTALEAAKAKSERSYCALAFSVGEDPQELVQLELFTDECPTLVTNFLQITKKSGFNGHLLHRVKAGAWIQAGDIVDGSGGHSEASSGGLLQHESVSIPHDRPGLLGMSCHGKDTIGSQFYITMRELPFLDGKFVIIGRVIRGMRTVLKIGELQTQNERPVKDVRVFLKP